MAVINKLSLVYGTGFQINHPVVYLGLQFTYETKSTTVDFITTNWFSC